MDLELNNGEAYPVSRSKQRKRIFQRQLLNRLSESRMLEILDRGLQQAHHNLGSCNQKHETQDIDQLDEKDEEELVCVSTMIRMANTDPALSESTEFQTGCVLKTVRYIHRQRAVGSGNQTNH
ncbi:uncharacterized protein PHALS_14953 [Plasmopara halstedii]|uniref:Uncharacterized protein n=1 Tax=Plasmopara halstedii TaxID=4781 RepID=A0A0P1A644_PLAHL|nr:uncharacterized protein PHALS_14953 [Plasmopara halstedii]CEG35701.1 hypothetical protein PHALS_14953 [Plasmopara halstedii]|eukprot:XP_024572070.1 hypothetical protein PHALS_14953 [Plasmopara halstedii]